MFVMSSMLRKSCFEMFFILALLLTQFDFIRSATATKALVSCTYVDPTSNVTRTVRISGTYGYKRAGRPAEGVLAHVLTRADNSTSNDACSPGFNHAIPREKWVALIERGNCKFTTKISNAVKHTNASAVIVYNNRGTNNLTEMIHNVDGVTAVMIGATNGRKLGKLADNGVRIYVKITASSAGKTFDNRYPLFGILAVLIAKSLSN